MVYSAMAHLSGTDRSQMLLLPEVVDDYVGPDNPVRFIEAFIDGLNLQASGFVRVEPKGTGRPGYDPADLLKLYLYGYLNRVRSSRRLEVETHRNIEVIWLLRHLKPDHKTIANFRRVNHTAFRQVFREFVIVCRQLDVFGRELLAVDGTRIKAVNNKDRNFTRAALTKFIREADERLTEYMKRLDDGDAQEKNTGSGGPRAKNLTEKIAAIKGKRDRHKALLDELDRTGEDQISLTDPDSRATARMTKVGVGYNIQLAVDVKHKLIAEQEVSSQVVDMGLLTQTTQAAMDTLGVGQIEVVADRGYFKVEDIEACEKAGITAYVPKPLRGAAVREGFFSKDEFRYDAGKDVYVCPAGQHLSPRYEKKTRDLKLVEYCNRDACRSCGLKPHCTHGYRRVGRVENEAVLDRMAARLAARPEVLDQRRESVEHPFGTIKQWMYQGAFLMRRLENVRGEFSLTALAYNIRRAITLVGVTGLIAAIRA
ncbi:IS1182 family transposase [Rhizobium sp. VS19-DR104.2]|uniref:IS1182 family transposase n=3 Tax=Rhizobium TaxID=379 RepID=UPI001CCABD7B|nr:MULTISPECIES: IS1182 family transposase [unclassified Rhizobium]MBZ5775718.1 IS1182 family transposase [Rhizobium sp. VS19-DRK62.2]MBZ5832570.1 IS1182 family transposase [Rhizobium sp. VS19-DR104.2]MBZ5843607.1 IS1182 family transposase [Rhizobium sp. VS19-DR104.1]